MKRAASGISPPGCEHRARRYAQVNAYARCPRVLLGAACKPGGGGGDGAQVHFAKRARGERRLSSAFASFKLSRFDSAAAYVLTGLALCCRHRPSLTTPTTTTTTRDEPPAPTQSEYPFCLLWGKDVCLRTH
jgi:hypothetical protein